MNIVKFQQGDAFGNGAQALAAARDEIGVLPEGSMRRMLYELQAEVTNLPEVDCPLQHVFAPGVYARTIMIPAGTVVVGKIHKHAHVNILSQGEVTVVTESGGRENFCGPITMVSQPGTKRAVYAHTAVVWTTIHLTDKTDLDEIEDHVIAKTYAEYESFALNQKNIEDKTS
jgi:hypothetical protein